MDITITETTTKTTTITRTIRGPKSIVSLSRQIGIAAAMRYLSTKDERCYDLTICPDGKYILRDRRSKEHHILDANRYIRGRRVGGI